MRMCRSGRWSSASGFSVTEIATVLTVMSVMSSAAAPAINDYVEQAKLVRATHDVRTLGATFIRFTNDVTPERNVSGGWATFDLLVGGGAAPPADEIAADWSRPIDDDAVGLLDDHLTTNGGRYSSGRGLGWPGWRGSYLEDRVKADPWGHRYAINVGSLREPGHDVIVLSAGPDGVVSSSAAGDGLPTEGDDMVALITSGAYR